MPSLARARLVLALGAPVVAATGCWTGGAAEPRSPAPASDAATGEAAPPAPRRAPACLITVGPPVAATSLGTLRLELPDGEALARLDLQWTAADGSAGTSIQLGNALASTMTAPPGTYAAVIETQTGARVRCAGIPIAAGGATTVTVTRLAR